MESKDKITSNENNLDQFSINQPDFLRRLIESDNRIARLEAELRERQRVEEELRAQVAASRDKIQHLEHAVLQHPVGSNSWLPPPLLASGHPPRPPRQPPSSPAGRGARLTKSASFPHSGLHSQNSSGILAPFQHPNWGTPNTSAPPLSPASVWPKQLSVGNGFEQGSIQAAGQPSCSSMPHVQMSMPRPLTVPAPTHPILPHKELGVRPRGRPKGSSSNPKRPMPYLPPQSNPAQQPPLQRAQLSAQSSNLPPFTALSPSGRKRKGLQDTSSPPSEDTSRKRLRSGIQSQSPPVPKARTTSPLRRSVVSVQKEFSSGLTTTKDTHPPAMSGPPMKGDPTPQGLEPSKTIVPSAKPSVQGMNTKTTVPLPTLVGSPKDQLPNTVSKNYARQPSPKSVSRGPKPRLLPAASGTSIPDEILGLLSLQHSQGGSSRNMTQQLPLAKQMNPRGLPRKPGVMASSSLGRGSGKVSLTGSNHLLVQPVVPHPNVQFPSGLKQEAAGGGSMKLGAREGGVVVPTRIGKSPISPGQPRGPVPPAGLYSKGPVKKADELVAETSATPSLNQPSSHRPGEFHKSTSDNDQKDKQMATGESTDSDDKGLKLSQGSKRKKAKRRCLRAVKIRWDDIALPSAPLDFLLPEAWRKGNLRDNSELVIGRGLPLEVLKRRRKKEPHSLIYEKLKAGIQAVLHLKTKAEVVLLLRKCEAKSCLAPPNHARADSIPVTELWCDSHRPENAIRLKPLCLLLQCQQPPRFAVDFLDPQPRLCAQHAYPGTIDTLQKKCREKRCRRIPSYGLPGRPGSAEFCNKHKPAESTPVEKKVKRKLCESAGCSECAVYGFDGECRRFCRAHMLEGMTENVNKVCEQPGCRKKSTCGFQEERSRFCSLHKLEGMVLKQKRCEEAGCTKVCSHGFEGNRRQFCRLHALPGMVDLKHRRCAFPHQFCPKNPTFGFDGSKPEYCKQHRIPGMKDLRNRRTCKVSKCFNLPLFGFNGEQPTVCQAHARQGMNDIRLSKCEAARCQKAPTHGYIGAVPLLCSSHAQQGMVDTFTIVRKRCENNLCNKLPFYGDVNDQKRRFCYQHKDTKMVDLRLALVSTNGNPEHKNVIDSKTLP